VVPKKVKTKSQNNEQLLLFVVVEYKDDDYSGRLDDAMRCDDLTTQTRRTRNFYFDFYKKLLQYYNIV